MHIFIARIFPIGYSHALKVTYSKLNRLAMDSYIDANLTSNGLILGFTQTLKKATLIADRDDYRVSPEFKI